jgi:protein-disulfide isomerase
MKRLLPFAIIIIVLVGAVAAGWVILRSSRDQKNTPPPTPDPAGEVKGAEPAHMRGNPKAPVLLEEFGDFQCPACGSYHPEMKKIEAEFGDKLKVIFRELPLLPMHEHALMAAQAAEAAGVQGKFWEMHDLLYENQTKWVEQKDLVPLFVDYAKQIGLNPDQFMKDLNGEIVAQRIFQDGKRAHSFGLKGTPSFFVNGKEAKDKQWEPEGLRQMIRDAIAASGK